MFLMISIDIFIMVKQKQNFIPAAFIGRSKSESIKEIIEEYYSDVEVETYTKRAEDVPEEVYSAFGNKTYTGCEETYVSSMR